MEGRSPLILILFPFVRTPYVHQVVNDGVPSYTALLSVTGLYLRKPYSYSPQYNVHVAGATAVHLRKQSTPSQQLTLPPLADTMHASAPELHPVLAPPGCQVKALGGASPSGRSTRWTSTNAEESRTTIDAGASDGTANSS